MRKIDIAKLFQRLCRVEYELLKYINRKQGKASAPINFYDTAEFLKVDTDDIRRAIKRLVDASVLLADGDAFQINQEVYKDEVQSNNEIPRQ